MADVDKTAVEAASWVYEETAESDDLAAENEYEESSNSEEPEDDEDDYYSCGGTEDEHLDDLFSVFGGISPELDEKEAVGNQEIDEEHVHGETPEYESDMESDAELSSQSDDDALPTHSVDEVSSTSESNLSQLDMVMQSVALA